MKKISMKDLDNLGFVKMSREALKNVYGGTGCQPHEFTCGDGSCIDASRMMDGVIDCPDGSDENDARRCLDRHTHCGTGTSGTCEQRNDGKCVCNTGRESWISEECVA